MTAFAEQVVVCMRTLKPRALTLVRGNPQCDINDVLQRTILLALEHEHQFIPGTNLRAWLRAVLRTAFFQELNGRKFNSCITHTDVDDETVKSVVCPVTSPDTVVYFRQVCRTLDRLPDKERKAVVNLMHGGKLQPKQRYTALAAVQALFHQGV
jgi:DNA-directed RNA polymerase specialized sigma24 family protein